MAFDSQTRNKLQRMVGACRRLLTDEFDDQLQGLYGIYAQDGRVLELEKLTTLDDDNYQIAALLRDRVKHLTSGMASEKHPLAESVRRVLREQAFTLLNRFAALRMAEERGFVQECVGQGLKSKGFQVFETVARSGLGGAYERYVTFIHGMFDELSLDLGVLFDRWSPFGLLFPREPALLKFFDLLNDPELKPLWKEDETVGWIYQYFNGNDVKEMREAAKGGAPRNSRELAVRNQFFTPRYVVEFLTDNTLGRIWYEMTQGNTKLKEQSRYLVRRPDEIFLKPGEKAPEQPKRDNLSQEELLKQAVHIPHRPVKDPRTVLLLDPACGSMHFGLYAFDLFEVIYEEAWELEKRGAEFQSHPPGMLSLQETYATKEDFLKDVPRLIIEHNLHGIDIDPRCAQIAGLSLWLRAQKAWQRLGLKPAERPPIKRSNIVCAEPMPGEKELLREFVEREFPAEERGVILRLLETIFDKMQLAGEAGSLLKIEEEIRTAIEDARRQWQTARLRPEFFDPAQLASLDKRAGAQQELPAMERAAMAADLRSLTSEDFWRRVEDRIYTALRDYAEQAENGGGFQRRLFAEDAGRGFAFIDVCRKRYDMALMNPPFGDATASAVALLGSSFVRVGNDIGTAFVADAANRWCPKGRVGVLLSTAPWFKPAFEKWREMVFFGRCSRIQVAAHLSGEVLDGATVNASPFIIDGSVMGESTVVRLTRSRDLECDLGIAISALRAGESNSRLFYLPPAQAGFLPNRPFCYWASPMLRRTLAALPAFEGSGGYVRTGLQTSDEPRFCRAWWEIPCADTRWKPYSKSSPFSPFWDDYTWSELVGDGLREVSAFEKAKVQGIEFFWKAGVTYPSKSVLGFNVRLHPVGSGFAHSGCVAFSDDVSPLALLGFLGSRPVEYLISLFIGDLQGKTSVHPNQYEVGTIQRLPWPGLSEKAKAQLETAARRCVDLLRSTDINHEMTRLFLTPIRDGSGSIKAQATNALESERTAISGVGVARSEMDTVVLAAYGFTASDAAEMGSAFTDRFPPATGRWRGCFGEDGADYDISTFAHITVSWALGVSLGRWDIRYATGEKGAPELPDPIAPLAVCPPGMLQDAQGLPMDKDEVQRLEAKGEWNYPIEIPWDGILVDDPNHPLDIERRVREVIEIIWKNCAEAIEHEACEILGVKSLRDYFRKPAGFFADHLSRYSKSRRQAPIYWPLATASGGYTLWVYYHRLTDQTLFQCVNDFVKPKLEEANRDIERLRGELQRADSGNIKQREKLEELEDFTIELKEFHDELLRVAGLPYKPNLNDGVLITASPLWKLFRLPKWQKDLKACWAALEGEEYEWAHMAYTIWPDRVKKVCKTDRSIAIAHGLEEFCDVKAPEKKVKRGKKKTDAELNLEGGSE
jgi:hypothetical protein